MSKKVKIFIISVVVLISSFSFTDSYFEIAKNLDIFTTVYRELNNYYVDENQCFNPSTPYAVSRAACEYHLINLYKF